MQKLTKFFTGLIQNYLPGAYSFALILTLVSLLLVITLTPTSFIDAVDMWGSGLWKFNNFAMQMVLVLILGGAIAKSALMDRPIKLLGSLAKSNTSAVVWITIISIIACYLNWGFGLIISALISLEMIKFNRRLNNGLIISSAYSGFLVWHGGISGSIPLKLTNPSEDIGLLLAKPFFSLSETIFSTYNFTILFTTSITILIINYLLSKRKYKHSDAIDYNSSQDEVNHGTTFADRIESNKSLMLSLSAIGIVYIINYFLNGKPFNLPIMICIFMIVAMITNLNISNFVRSTSSSVVTCTGIIIQFPLYAGIMSLLSSSGLADDISSFFIIISSQNTFLFFTYISSGITNFFVPSGGGQWVIQGPIIMKAASEIGINQAHAALAISWGDAWTNMIQPFWAIPILSILNCKLKDFMGYSLITFLCVGAIQSILFLL